MIEFGFCDIRDNQGLDKCIGLGREGTELRVLHTTREAVSSMPVTARPVRLEQGVKHSGIVTSEAEGY